MAEAEPIFVFLRVVVALAAVLGLIWFLGRRVAARGISSKEQKIEVIARQGLSAKASVVVVEFDERRYVLGVTDHSVTTLDRHKLRDAGQDPTQFRAFPAPPGQLAHSAPLENPAQAYSPTQQYSPAQRAQPEAAHTNAAHSDPVRTGEEHSGREQPGHEHSGLDQPNGSFLSYLSAARQQQKTAPSPAAVFSRDTWRQAAQALKNRRGH
ncbi:flagellar biosynthetic protein FliO [Nesterenkonia massiliensis]|uniref:Flagellar protein n=1 Tax=Nesterenkonia massiliensis TaxID=1232429 RepID=A0ABT2HNL3_9MICC|nr:flagellar biosynthetic protein FliO [Nesterenkonia massiliensis]